jgi:hypothetical protein
VSVTTFKTDEDVLSIANDTLYGLGARGNKYAPHLVAHSGGSGWTDDRGQIAFGRSGSVSLW